MKRLALASLSLLLLLAAANAQVFRSGGGGPPASVTSMTGSGFNPGIPASVTSMRPVFRAAPSQEFFHHRFHHHRQNFVPIYPYYGYGYPIYGDYDLTNEDSYTPAYAQPQPPAAPQPEPQAPAQTVFENRPGYQAPAPPANATAVVSAPVAAPAAPAEKAAPEEPEPNTVLVFKDGHKLEVGNYVI